MQDNEKFLSIEEEVKRFNDLETEVNETINMIQQIIDIFNKKSELAKGNAGKLVLLFEQKISLLGRKESIINNIATMKKNMFNANSKIKSAEDGDTDFAKILSEYTEAINRQQKAIEETKKSVLQTIGNKEEVEHFFN